MSSSDVDFSDEASSEVFEDPESTPPRELKRRKKKKTKKKKTKKNKKKKTKQPKSSADEEEEGKFCNTRLLTVVDLMKAAAKTNLPFRAFMPLVQAAQLGTKESVSVDELVRRVHEKKNPGDGLRAHPQFMKQDLADALVAVGYHVPENAVKGDWGKPDGDGGPLELPSECEQVMSALNKIAAANGKTAETLAMGILYAVQEPKDVIFAREDGSEMEVLFGPDSESDLPSSRKKQRSNNEVEENKPVRKRLRRIAPEKPEEEPAEQPAEQPVVHEGEEYLKCYLMDCDSAPNYAAYLALCRDDFELGPEKILAEDSAQWRKVM